MEDFINLFDISNKASNDNFVYHITATAYSQCVSAKRHHDQSCCSLLTQ